MCNFGQYVVVDDVDCSDVQDCCTHAEVLPKLPPIKIVCILLDPHVASGSLRVSLLKMNDYKITRGLVIHVHSRLMPPPSVDALPWQFTALDLSCLRHDCDDPRKSVYVGTLSYVPRTHQDFSHWDSALLLC